MARSMRVLNSAAKLIDGWDDCTDVWGGSGGCIGTAVGDGIDSGTDGTSDSCGACGCGVVGTVCGSTGGVSGKSTGCTGCGGGAAMGRSCCQSRMPATPKAITISMIAAVPMERRLRSVKISSMKTGFCVMCVTSPLVVDHSNIWHGHSEYRSAESGDFGLQN